MKKSTLCIFLIFWFCNFINTANAVIKTSAGVGELHLSEKITDGYFDYVTKPLSKLPLVFFISEDKKDFYSVIISNDGGSYAGSGTIIKKKAKCELKLKKKCNVFSNTNVIVWDNGINSNDPKKSKIDRKISKEDFIIKLTKLGFIINEQQQLIKKKKNAKQKVNKEKELAKQKVLEEKTDQTEIVKTDKKIAEKKVLEDKKITEEKLNKKLSLIPAETDLEKAQNFINIIKNFVKQNPDEFDILKLSEFFVAIKPISNGSLDSKLKNDLELLKQFMNSSSVFVKHYEDIKKEKRDNKLNKINDAISSLENNIKIIKGFLLVDTNSIYLEEWLNTIKNVESIINDPSSYDQLILVNDDLIKLRNSKNEIDRVTNDLNNNIDELKEILKQNLTTDLVPLIIKQSKILELAIKNQILSDMKLANQKFEEFILKTIEEPKLKAAKEKKIIKEKQLAEEKKLRDKQLTKEKKLRDKQLAKEKMSNEIKKWWKSF